MSSSDATRGSSGSNSPTGADRAASSDADDLWSGTAVSPGSELTNAYLPAFAVLAVPAVIVGILLGALLPGLSWWMGLVAGLVVAGIAVWLVGRRADQLVLSSLGPSVPRSEYPERLTNMVDGLTLSGGVIEPSLVLIDEPARNAMAVRRADRNHLVVTTGLVSSLGVVELEGAVAELLTRLRNGDAEAATVGAALLGRFLVDGPLGVVLAPLGWSALDRLLSADRDLEADRQAVTLTRYPPGLLRALQAIESGDSRVGAATAGTAHLWLADPIEATSEQTDRRVPLSLRIDALAEL